MEGLAGSNITITTMHPSCMGEWVPFTSMRISRRSIFSYHDQNAEPLGSRIKVLLTAFACVLGCVRVCVTAHGFSTSCVYARYLSSMRSRCCLSYRVIFLCSFNTTSRLPSNASGPAGVVVDARGHEHDQLSWDSNDVAQSQLMRKEQASVKQRQAVAQTQPV